MKKILIIDTKAGNLFSLRAAIERLDYQVEICDKPNDKFFDGVVVPGQGRFGTVMKNIRLNRWDEYLNNIRQQQTPILGICVGMQIFFEASDEDQNIKGLSWFSGKAEALKFPKKPMIGWAKLTGNYWDQEAVYFVNSFAIKQSKYSIATTSYGEQFCAAIKCNQFTGVQFHPEKSAAIGSNIIKQSLALQEDSNV